MTSQALYERLRKDLGVATQAKNGRYSPYAEAVRISPATHARVEGVDRLADALVRIARG